MGNGTTRYQALDGVRAVAIFGVLLSHAMESPGMPQYPSWWWHLGDLGNLGVRIFFVLSGFIITHILLRESARHNRIDLRAFYVRRVFRIIPPLAALMGVVALGMALGYWQVPVRQFLLSLFFLGNYPWGGVGGWTLGHLWSLAVEEQFYLLWPAVLAFTIWRPGPPDGIHPRRPCGCPAHESFGADAWYELSGGVHRKLGFAGDGIAGGDPLCGQDPRPHPPGHGIHPGVAVRCDDLHA
jgi:peptidoglycan/LPS O-acetylase OafA/YrhL